MILMERQKEFGGRRTYLQWQRSHSLHAYPSKLALHFRSKILFPYTSLAAMKEKGGKRKTSRRILGPNLLHIFKKINREKNGIDSNEDESGNEEEGDTSQQVVFKYKWLKTWEWMRYDKDENVVFCTTCESFAITGNSPYAKGGCKNLKTSSFNEHAACKTHLIAEARKLDHAKPRKPVVSAFKGDRIQANFQQLYFGTAVSSSIL